MHDVIIIESSPSEVFRVLVDPKSVGLIFENVRPIKLNTIGSFIKGSAYKRIFYSHGMPNYQVVTFVELIRDKAVTTKTRLVGYDVIYRYTMESVLETAVGEKTSLSLKKEVQGGWRILKPLVMHLLTRPEHNGDHLTRIKQLIEAGLPT